MKKTIIQSVLLLVCGALSAQNINQSVQVTNEYQAKFADFPKQEFSISVPDTLYRFDYDFDYSVFETTYKGSYEFSPYEIALNPEPVKYDINKFYLKAGAGYGLHPELDFAYNLISKEKFNLSIFNTGGGEAVTYHLRDNNNHFFGYNLKDSFALSGRHVMPSAELDFKLGYDGIFAKSSEDLSSAYNSAIVSASISSTSTSRIAYSLGVDYRYGYESFSADLGALNESLMNVSGYVGFVTNKKYKVLVDFGFKMDNVANNSETNVPSLASNLGSVTPKILLTFGPVDLRVGVKLDYASFGDDNLLKVYPVAKAQIALGTTHRAFLSLDGGLKMNSQYSLKTLYPFFMRIADSVQAISQEKYNASLGVDGVIASRLQYVLSASYSSWTDMPLAYYGNIGYADLDMLNVTLNANWISEDFELGGYVRWNNLVKSQVAAGFAPAAIEADVTASYNWYKRAYISMGLEVKTARKDLSRTLADVPAYYDLKLGGEYKFSSKISAYAQVGNLLFQTIERCPGFAEKGPYLTAGIIVNF